ncbi:hypothetical protein [Pseudomonas avellanae]|uniref:hypothetical protein n=1 Tax=Pseudomonas avellanae TaxID=46257 RepID=UPI000462B07F|nr:hypothetical protein [Pseudomonas avellanae]UQW76406.1 hypothetical protein L2Y01_11855 [Pseudomonas avellanae]
MKKIYHDSSLVGIQSSGDSVTLKFMINGDRAIYVELLEPKLFRVCDYIMQNSTSRLFLMDISYEMDEIKKKLTWASSLDGKTSHLSQEAIDKYYFSIAKKELFLLVLEPNWGAEVVVLCRGIAEI